MEALPAEAGGDPQARVFAPCAARLAPTAVGSSGRRAPPDGTSTSPQRPPATRRESRREQPHVRHRRWHDEVRQARDQGGRLPRLGDYPDWAKEAGEKALTDAG